MKYGATPLIRMLGPKRRTSGTTPFGPSVPGGVPGPDSLGPEACSATCGVRLIGRTSAADMRAPTFRDSSPRPLASPPGSNVPSYRRRQSGSAVTPLSSKWVLLALAVAAPGTARRTRRPIGWRGAPGGG